MFDLTGKVAFVTGASSGIGRASALALANQGAKVVVTARRLEKLQALAAEIKQRGHEALPLAMDVTKKEAIDAAIAETIKTFGRLDILLNNAGVAEFAAFLDMTEAQWDKTIDTNLKGYFWVSQAAAAHMAKNKWGRIINIASIASGSVGVGFPQIAQYCASKGGVIGMTEALAIELILLSRAPLKRAGKPEEIAAAVVYLASDEASYTTGATLYVDGGWLAA